LQFYNLRTKELVEVPTEQIRKRRSVRMTSGGVRQERYAAVAEVTVDGHPLKLYKFVSRAVYDGLQVPEVP
jgi:hypothetical protein